MSRPTLRPVPTLPVELLDPADDASSGLAGLVFGLVAAYLVTGRVIADVYTLPIGLSLHPTDLILAALLVVWLLWMFTAPQPFPIGIVSMLGAAFVIVFLVSPFLNAIDMSEFEANGAERGLVRATLYAGLFVASYQLSSASRRRAVQILTVTVVVSVFQALVAVYETVTGSALVLLGTIWQTVGLEVDPRAVRTDIAELQLRLTGELRASATAPHPLVLAGLMALGIGICVAFYLYSDSRRTRNWLLVAFALQLLAVGATNQRTGFVVLAAIAVVVAITQINRLPSALPLAAMTAVGGVAVAVLSPNTPRLILNFITGQQTDHNVAVRTSKYEIFPDLIERRPILGAGFTTSDPELVTFDNGYLTGFVEFGIVGFGLLLAFLLVITGRSFAALHKARLPDQPILLAGILAAITFFTSMTTFDVMSFSQLFPDALVVIAVGVARADARHRALAVP